MAGRFFRWVGVLAIAATLIGPAPVLAQDLAPVPALAARVTDAANRLPAAERAALEQKLGAFEGETGGQLAVLIVPTAAPETIEQYALRVAETWKIGHKGKDNGALIVLAMQERKVRIEVGYGWEGALPDVEAKRIIREVMAPYFKQDQFAAGLSAGVDKIRLAVARDGQAGAGKAGDPGAWQQSHQVGTADALQDTLLQNAPAVVGMLAVLAFLLPAVLLAGFATLGVFLWTGSGPAAGLTGVIVFIVAVVLRNVFGFARGSRLRRRDRGGLDSPWISTGGGGGWSSGGGSGGGWSGGGGDFGGGGASGDW